MILLTSSSDLLEVVTGASVSDIYVQASFVDLSSVNVLTPGRQNTIITTATTTTVVPSPAAGTNRALKNLCIFNSSASPCQVSILHTDGTNSVEIFNYTTQTGESIYWSEGRGFYVQDADGNLKTGQTTTAAGSNGDIQYNNNGVPGGSAATATAAGTIDLPAGQVLKFGTDTGISRNSAGVVDIGNGTAADVSGTIKAATAVLSTSLQLAGNTALTTQSGTTSAIVATALFSLHTAPSGDVLTADGSGNVQDSGTLLSALAKLLSPAFTGTPTAPTQSALTNNTDIATTAYTDAAVAVETSRAEAAEALKAPLSGPALTGIPTAPTASPFDNSTEIATDAYVDQVLYGGGYCIFIDDFLSPGINTTISGTVNIAGQTGTWGAAPITGGTTGTIDGSLGTFLNPGQVTLTTPATSGDGLGMWSSFNGLGGLGDLGSNAGWQADFWIKTPATITNYAFRIGFVTSNAGNVASPSAGIWVEYDTANTGKSNSDWTLVTVAGSSANYVASAVSPVASTWYHFRISCSAAGTINLQVASANGSLGTAVSSSTDVPTGVNLQICTQIFPRSNAAVTTIIDRTSYVAATQRI